MMDAKEAASTRPYLIRALYEWCTDNGLTPFVAVRVDDSVRVPTEYVKDGEIVLNVSFDATSALKLGNEMIEFKGRFGGIARDIRIPVDHVMAIYARETGQGMAFPMLAAPSPIGARTSDEPVKHVGLSTVPDTVDDTGPETPRPPTGGRPALTRIK
jgi:stringent starvation protein B